MINIDSKNALSMMKFDMEIAKTQYFDIAKRCWRLSCMQGVMEGVLPKVRCQIIADFNGKNAAKWKMFTVRHFKKMECKKIAIYRVMQQMDAGKSVTQTKSRVF